MVMGPHVVVAAQEPWQKVSLLLVSGLKYLVPEHPLCVAGKEQEEREGRERGRGGGEGERGREREGGRDRVRGRERVGGRE